MYFCHLCNQAENFPESTGDVGLWDVSNNVPYLTISFCIALWPVYVSVFVFQLTHIFNYRIRWHQGSADSWVMSTEFQFQTRYMYPDPWLLTLTLTSCTSARETLIGKIYGLLRKTDLHLFDPVCLVRSWVLSCHVRISAPPATLHTLVRTTNLHTLKTVYLQYYAK